MVRYPLEQSPLFRISALGVLGRLLKVHDSQQLLQLERRNRKDFERFYHRRQVGKRDVQSLRGDLKPIHRRLFGLLSRLETPGYLISSQCGLCSIDNARIHQSPDLNTLSIDVKKFFASTRHSAVLRFFLNRLQVAPDLAHLLANLCCYQEKRLPLGSPISQSLAFWANEALFHEVSNYAVERNLTFSAYVDDLTFSSQSPVSRTCHQDIQSILHKHGLTIHWGKVCYRPAGHPKLITGCLITNKGELDVPPELRKKTMKALRWFRSGPSLGSGTRALGLIQSVRAIVPNEFLQERASLKRELKELRKQGC